MVKRGLQNVKSLRKVLNPSNLAFSFNKHDLKNNIKEVRIATVQKMVEIGLGGHLELSIKRLGKIDYRRDKISRIKEIFT